MPIPFKPKSSKYSSFLQNDGLGKIPRQMDSEFYTLNINYNHDLDFHLDSMGLVDVFLVNHLFANL
jgi:hypothetical protein